MLHLHLVVRMHLHLMVGVHLHLHLLQLLLAKELIVVSVVVLLGR